MILDIAEDHRVLNMPIVGSIRLIQIIDVSTSDIVGFTKQSRKVLLKRDNDVGKVTVIDLFVCSFFLFIEKLAGKTAIRAAFSFV